MQHGEATKEPFLLSPSIRTSRDGELRLPGGTFFNQRSSWHNVQVNSDTVLYAGVMLRSSRGVKERWDKLTEEKIHAVKHTCWLRKALSSSLPMLGVCSHGREVSCCVPWAPATVTAQTLGWIASGLCCDRGFKLYILVTWLQDENWSLWRVFIPS